MPTYGYECTQCGSDLEVFQRITDEPLKTCLDCGGDLRKLVFPVGIVFKGSGFYVNDYANKAKSESNNSDKSTDAKSAETKAVDTKASDPKPADDTASTSPATEKKSESKPAATAAATSS